MKNKTIQATIIIVVLALGLVAYYAYLSNRSNAQKSAKNKRLVQEVLSVDLTKRYPGTAREVMKFYNQIMECLYREECTEEEIKALGGKARELYDEEFLAANPEDAYQVRLLAEVEDYKKNKRKITASSVASASSVDSYEQDGHKFSRILCVYTLVTDGQSRPVNTVYLLRRDGSRKWKIYGWGAAENLWIYQTGGNQAGGSQSE